MKIIVCIDDEGGMMFNNRRQSRDRVLVEDVIKMTEGKKLYIDAYSELLFADFAGKYTTDSYMMQNACDDDYCFVENKMLGEHIDRINELIIYRWNRRYPSDLRLDIVPENSGFVLCETAEFAGYSHDNITKEIFRR